MSAFGEMNVNGKVNYSEYKGRNIYIPDLGLQEINNFSPLDEPKYKKKKKKNKELLNNKTII